MTDHTEADAFTRIVHAIAQRQGLTPDDGDLWLDRCDNIAVVLRDYEAVTGNLIDPDGCGCYACIGNKPTGIAWLTVGMTRMIVCGTCGNKRCPHATDHRNPCTGSNEPGQPGSRYAPAPHHEAAAQDLMDELLRPALAASPDQNHQRPATRHHPTALNAADHERLVRIAAEGIAEELAAEVDRIVTRHHADARAAYLDVLNWWHEADPDHCGGECFREASIRTHLNIPNKPQPKPEPPQ